MKAIQLTQTGIIVLPTVIGQPASARTSCKALMIANNAAANMAYFVAVMDVASSTIGLLNEMSRSRDQAQFRRARIARPITQSLSLSDRKLSSSVKWVTRWR